MCNCLLYNLCEQLGVIRARKHLYNQVVLALCNNTTAWKIFLVLVHEHLFIIKGPEGKHRRVHWDLPQQPGLCNLVLQMKRNRHLSTEELFVLTTIPKWVLVTAFRSSCVISHIIIVGDSDFSHIFVQHFVQLLLYSQLSHIADHTLFVFVHNLSIYCINIY